MQLCFCFSENAVEIYLRKLLPNVGEINVFIHVCLSTGAGGVFLLEDVPTSAYYGVSTY